MNTIAPVNRFSFPRFLQLSKRVFNLNKKTWTVGFFTICSIFILFWIFPLIFSTSPWHMYNTSALIPGAMFFYSLCGLLITSSIFDEIHSPNTAFLHFTLPATTFEKLGSVWVLTTVVYTIAAIAVITILTAVIQLLTNLSVGTQIPVFMFNPLDGDILRQIGLYVSYHSVFLLGAIIFKKHHFIKTILSIVVFSILATFTAGLLFVILAGTEQMSVSMSILPDGPFYLGLHLLAALVLLTISYYCLKNKQVV